MGATMPFVSIPSTSGKPVRPDGTVNTHRRRLNPFNIREAGQTLRCLPFFNSVGSQSLQHQGSRSDGRRSPDEGLDQSQSLQHQGSRSDDHRLHRDRRAIVSIPSTSGKPVRRTPVPCRRGLRLNPFNIREAGQTLVAPTPSTKSLNPFNIREAGQTLRSKFVNADKHLQGCLETKRRSEKLTLGMGARPRGGLNRQNAL